MKYWSLSILALGVLSNTSMAATHAKDATDKKDAAAETELAPEYTKVISQFKSLENDEGSKKVFTKNFANKITKESKDLKKEEMTLIREFLEASQYYSGKLKACAPTDAHASKFDELLKRCAIGEVAKTFLQIDKEEVFKRTGAGSDRFIAGEREFLQCFVSVKAVIAERKTKITGKDLESDKNLEERFGKLIEMFGYKEETLAAIKGLPGKKLQEVVDLQKEATKEVKDNSCVVPKPAKPAASTTTNNNSNSGANANSDATEGEGNDESTQDEDEDAPELVSTYRSNSTAASGGGAAAPGGSNAQPQQPPQAPGTVQPFPGLGNGAIDPSALNPFNNGNFPFDPNALLEGLQRPDGARVGGSNTRGAPSFQAPSGGGSPGGGGDQSPQQPQEPPQQQPIPPFPYPQQQPPVVIGNDTPTAKETPKEEKANPRPEKEDINAAGRKGFDAGAAAAMAAFQQGMMYGQNGQANGAAPYGRYSTASKMRARNSRGKFGRTGSMSSSRRRTGNARGRTQASNFQGTGNLLNSSRTPNSNIGRGSPGIP